MNQHHSQSKRLRKKSGRRASTWPDSESKINGVAVIRCLISAAALLCSLLPPASLAAQSLQTQTQPQPPAATQQSPAPQPQQAKPPLPLEQILARLPRRVSSKDGKSGDMINFLILGPKEKVQAALEAAGWVAVDRTPQDAIVHVLSEVLEKRAYSEMPMSPLYLFGRPQDFGYAQGIPIHIVTERDHFRLWEAPWLLDDGQTVWVGAGTHDIGIEKDSSDQLTHAIDPDVDKEREFIVGSLQDAGAVKDVRYLAPADPVLQALTATGDPFHSDGRIVVIALK
jgi:hypothetical protein